MELFINRFWYNVLADVGNGSARRSYGNNASGLTRIFQIKNTTMNTKNDDIGIAQALLARFENQRLPRMVEIKKRLDDGIVLNEFEIEYISEAVHDARLILPYVDHHPEYEALVSKVIHYYKLITDEALDNEKNS